MKVTSLLLLIAGLLFPSFSYADYKDWTKQNQRLYVSAMTLHTMDALQTFVMIECQQTNPHCPYYEKNPFLGDRPSKRKVVAVVGITELISFKLLDSDRLTPRQRKRILIMMNSVAVYPIANNEQNGLGFYIPLLPFRSFIK